VLVVTSVLMLAGCSEDDSDFRRTLEDGFPGGLGIPPPHVDNLRAALGGYHMAPADIDCMIEQIRLDGRLTDVGSSVVDLTADELDGYAEECSVDFSTLWYMID
jgi:hypothetical protein